MPSASPPTDRSPSPFTRISPSRRLDKRRFCPTDNESKHEQHESRTWPQHQSACTRALRVSALRIHRWLLRARHTDWEQCSKMRSQLAQIAPCPSLRLSLSDHSHTPSMNGSVREHRHTHTHVIIKFKFVPIWSIFHSQ